jgi:hypothetical protein
MALTLLTASPSDSTINVSIDSKIQLDFNAAVDPFTVANGISVYSVAGTKWTGSMMSELDTGLSDVSSPFDGIHIIEYSYAISGNSVYITPTKPLDRHTQYYIQIVPGTDPSRFLSLKTTSNLIYSYATSGRNPEVNITGPYSGTINAVYTINISSITASGGVIDVSIDGIYDNSYQFFNNIEFSLNKKLTLSIEAGFEVGDSVSIPVFAPVGISGIYKIQFTTSDYTTSQITSTKIEDKLYNLEIASLKVVSTIPASLSLNNSRCNPIIVKFNKPIDLLQDFTSKIRIFKINIESGSAKRINYYVKPQGDTVKIYMISVDSMAEVSDLPIFDVAIEPFSITSNYKLVYQSENHTIS